MWRYLLPGAVFLVLCGFFVAGLYRDPTLVASPLIGKPAPEFSLPSLQDAAYPISTKDLAGRPWVLNVWGTWCPECRAEHDMLMQAAAEQRLPLVGLNWKDDNAAALAWLAQLGNPYAAVAVDQEGRTAIDFGVYGAPETFLIDAQGVVVHRHVGALTREVWERDFLARLPAGASPGGAS